MFVEKDNKLRKERRGRKLCISYSPRKVIKLRDKWGGATFESSDFKGVSIKSKGCVTLSILYVTTIWSSRFNDTVEILEDF